VIDLKSLFNAFSKRPEVSTKAKHEIPQTTRTRVMLWCRELYSNSRTDLATVGRGDCNGEFWQEIHARLLMRTGRLPLSETDRSWNGQEATKYMFHCSGEEFLDFMEDIFSAETFFHVSIGDDKLVDELNALLQIDNLPYHLTHFVKETVQESSPRGYGSRTVTYTRAFPKVVVKENEVLHSNAMEPALTLLQQPHFLNANKEYLAALEDYRKGDLNDCIVKCCSAFESVLKVICDRKGWSYKQTDTASTLVKTVLSNTALDSYFESLLLIIATLRNRLSSAHGAGTIAKQPSRQVAQYALNATASAVVLLVQETGA
jgi:hypothetical protein